MVANHGKDSEELGKICDQQQALASMEPKISFTLPGHLRSSRHSQLVTGLEQSDQWLARVASQDLINAGTAKPAEEQLFMFSERLASSLRNSDADKRGTLLKETFMLDYEYDLEEPTHEFVGAMAVVVRYEECTDLEVRADLLKDALAVLSKHVPDLNQKFPGTLLGSALIGTHAGEQLLRDARLAASIATATVEGTQKFLGHCRVYHAQKSWTPFVIADPNAKAQCEGVNEALIMVCDSWERDFVAPCPGFKPTPETAELKAALQDHLIAALAGFASVLAPVLNRECRGNRIEAWASATEAVRPRMHATVACLAKARVMMHNDFFDDVVKANAMVKWFVDVIVILKQDATADLRFIKMSQKTLVQRFKPFHQDVVSTVEKATYLEHAVGQFLTCPLFGSTGSYAASVETIIDADGDKEIRPLCFVFVLRVWVLV